MAGYRPIYISGMQVGLIQSREDFLLPNDAYPVLENMYVWRERIKRRQGLLTLGRLSRTLTLSSIGNTGASPWSFNIYSTIVPAITGEPDAQITVGTIVIVLGGAITLTDQGNGTLTSVTPGNSGTINYSTGNVILTHTAGAGVAAFITFSYFPDLPNMGLPSRELDTINIEQLVAWDTKYAYKFQAGKFIEFIPGTTWTGTDSDFFWTTNWFVGDGNAKIFWATNFSGVLGDPIRYTNSIEWVDFAPQINVAGDVLAQCLALVPFRGRFLAFNTFEGPNLAGSQQFFQRIRWSAIGTPFTTPSAIVTNVNANAWRDDIKGQGGFLDIPTAQSIVGVGFVRDNLVVFCERSTWQLRYTGRTIQPFQIEKVNSELGSESTFSQIQFDTSLVGIGDKGVVECDSFKSSRIDIKIPDLVFEFKNANEGTKRIYGIRDFQQRLAYWTYVYNPGDAPTAKFPNRRLVYNYENDSWAIFTDSLTALGTFQSAVARTWASCAGITWSEANFPWLDVPSQFPSLIGGNQQGYVMYLSSNLEPKVNNDPTLFIKNITGNTTTPTVVNSPNHNMVNGTVIKISDIPATTPFSNLNGQIFSIVYVDEDNFQLWLYNPVNGQFNKPQTDAPATYIGGGQIRVRDNFSIVSKKFNFLDEGQNIQLGFIDILVDNTESGSITLNVYLDYNESTPINVLPENVIPATSLPDTFFNSVIDTFSSGGIVSSKNWKRAFCPVRGNFITLQYTLSNEQMIGIAQESNVQIDAQILWVRPAGRQLPNA